MGCHALLQGIVLTQGLNSGLITSPGLAGGFSTNSATWEAPQNSAHWCCQWILPEPTS